MIKFIDMFSGIGGFREGLTRAGGFECVGHSEIDKYANRSYNALFDTKGEWFVEDARKADPETMPEFRLLCGGFPCQTFSIAGSRKGFGDPRGTLFFELARLAEARKPPYLLFENVPGLLSHDGGRTFATILNTLDRLGYGVEWQCLNSKDFGVPQSRNRVYIIGYLDERCRGKVFPFTETTGGSLIQTHGGHQGERVYSPEGLSCTLAANLGGFGGKTGLYEVGVPIKCATKTGYQMAQVGDSIDLSYATVNSRRGRVGKEIAHAETINCFSTAMSNASEICMNVRRARCRQVGAYLHWLYDHKYTDLDYSLQLPNFKRTAPQIPQVWSPEEIDKILAVIDTANPVGRRNYAIFLLLARTGLRISDVLGLKFSNINWKENCISLSQQKTGNALSLPLSKELGMAIISYLQDGRPQSSSAFIFLSHNAPFQPLGEHNNFNPEFHKYLRRAGIAIPTKRHTGVHTIRHSFATNMLRKGTPVQDVSQILGHSNISVTETYLRVDIEHMRLCSLSLEGLL